MTITVAVRKERCVYLPDSAVIELWVRGTSLGDNSLILHYSAWLTSATAAIAVHMLLLTAATIVAAADIIAASNIIAAANIVAADIIAASAAIVSPFAVAVVAADNIGAALPMAFATAATAAGNGPVTCKCFRGGLVTTLLRSVLPLESLLSMVVFRGSALAV